jgi:2'-5' RNA ligase
LKTVVIECRKNDRGLDMIKRSVMIFPEFENIEEIEEIRRKYDPLAKHVKPHITLVFPFGSHIEKNDLLSHIEKVILDISPFKLKMSGITGHKDKFGNYLFLIVHEGENEIIQLHKNLYTGILEEFHYDFLKNGYKPHLTVGKLTEEDKYTEALQNTIAFKEVFETMVNKVSVEIIEDNEDSKIEMEISLFR